MVDPTHYMAAQTQRADIHARATTRPIDQYNTNLARVLAVFCSPTANISEPKQREQQGHDEPRAKSLRVNKLVLKIVSWVASATLRRVELWDDNLVIPPALAARAAVLAFGDELIRPRAADESDSHWLSQGGREMAAAHLLPRAEAVLRQEL